MLELLLLRHAKSQRDGSDANGDHDRDLEPRGLAAAPAMGRFMSGQRLIPDLALCSTGTRTRRTWDLVAGAIGSKVRTRFLRELYLAAPAQLLDIVRQQEGPRKLLLIGHNPGLQDLALALAPSEPPLTARFPTGALASFALAGPWAQLGEAQAELTAYVVPRELP